MEISFKNFIQRTRPQIQKAVELGGGDGDDANWLCDYGAKRVVMIDKKKADKLNKCVQFIEGDYFDIENIGSEINDDKCDLIFACYSLCFNSKQHIESHLPFYLDKIKESGLFYILDFTPEEKIVTKRTNIWDIWFLTLLNKYFNHLEIKTQEVYEDAHKHTHNIFELVAFKE